MPASDLINSCLQLKLLIFFNFIWIIIHSIRDAIAMTQRMYFELNVLAKHVLYKFIDDKNLMDLLAGTFDK